MNTKTFYNDSNVNQLKGFSNANFFNEEKIRFVKEAISRELSIESIGKETIDTRLFNKCSRDFIETEKGTFVHNVKSEVTSFEITHLKNQNLLLKQLIAELSNENHLLREKLAENNSAKI
jgi:transposase-like protein